jgi:probable phosphoglycerate mutase
MPVKRIYFVRHGQTLANTLRIHQSADESLTHKGRLQAYHVAQKLRSLNVDTLICSTFVRARETAEIISDELSIPFTTEESVVEVRRPDHLYGQRYYSLQTILYLWRLFVYRETPSWDYNGAENIFALRNRIADTQNVIEGVEGEHIAIVSHDIFMNLFLVHVCRNKPLSLMDFLKILLVSKKTPNTTIFHFEFNKDAPKGVCAWQYMQTILPSHHKT